MNYSCSPGVGVSSLDAGAAWTAVTLHSKARHPGRGKCGLLENTASFRPESKGSSYVTAQEMENTREILRAESRIVLVSCSYVVVKSGSLAVTQTTPQA